MMRGSDCTLRDRANNERGARGRMMTGAGGGGTSQIQYVARIVVVVVAGDVLMMLSSRYCCCCCRLVAESHGTETNFRQRVNPEESEKQMQ